MAALSNADDATDTTTIPPLTTPITIPPWAGRRGGYTPFEYVGFPPEGEAEEITHEVRTVVRKPRDAVYAIWADRMNLGEWTTLLGQTVLHTADPDLCSYFFFYRWGSLPVLELYTTTRREVVEGEAVMERSVDGWAFAAAAFFADGPDPGTTAVTFRVAYALPSNLADAVGAAGVYAHVDEILRADGAEMARFCETADPAALAAARAAEEAALAARAARVAAMTEDDVYAIATAAEPEGLFDEVMEELEGAIEDWEGGEEGGGGGGGGGGVGGGGGAAVAEPKQQRKGRAGGE